MAWAEAPLGVQQSERAGVRRLPTRSAVHAGFQDLTAAVLVDGRERLTGDIPLAPLPERQNHRQQVSPRARQPVLVAWRTRRVLPPLDNTNVLQSAQPPCEDVARCSGVAGDVAEPPHPEEQLADHQERPLLADNLESAGDRTVAWIGDTGDRTHLASLA